MFLGWRKDAEVPKLLGESGANGVSDDDALFYVVIASFFFVVGAYTKEVR